MLKNIDEFLITKKAHVTNKIRSTYDESFIQM